MGPKNGASGDGIAQGSYNYKEHLQAKAAHPHMSGRSSRQGIYA